MSKTDPMWVFENYGEAAEHYSQGICGDGAAILCDGVPLTVDEIVARLNPCRAQAVAVEHNKPLCKHGCGQVAVYSFIGECDECHAKTLSKQLGLPAPQKESGQ